MNLPIQEAIHDSDGLNTRQAGFYTPNKHKHRKYVRANVQFIEQQVYYKKLVRLCAGPSKEHALKQSQQLYKCIFALTTKLNMQINNHSQNSDDHEKSNEAFSYHNTIEKIPNLTTTKQFKDIKNNVNCSLTMVISKQARDEQSKTYGAIQR